MIRIIYITLILFPIFLHAQLTPDPMKPSGLIASVADKDYARNNSVIVRPDGSQQVIRSKYGYSGFKTTFSYDTRGCLLRLLRETKYMLISKEDYSWDTVGHIAIMKTKFDKEGIILPGVTRTIESELDENQLPIGTKIYYDRSDSLLTTVHEFDVVYHDNILQQFKQMEIGIGGDTIESRIIEMEYDAEGRLTNITERSNGHYRYVEPNPITLTPTMIKTFDKESQVLRKTAFYYNPQGRIIKKTIQHLKDELKPGEKGRLYTFQYEYDKNGNWIKHYMIEANGERLLKTDRKITYRK